MSWVFWTIPLTGALIGWITNVFAIRLIFRPHRPIKLPVINITLQGVLPKRQADIARSVGRVVEEELLSVDDILNQVINSEARDRLLDKLLPAFRSHVINRLPSVLPTPLKNIIGDLLRDALRREAPRMVTEVATEIGEELKSEINIFSIVEEKINQLDMQGLERIVLRVASRELRHIEWMGAVLGFVIGILQLLYLGLVF